MGSNASQAGRSSGSSARRRVTLTMIANEVGVSPMTVSNAYNRPDQLSEPLREQILETAKRLGYHGPDPVGRSLRRQRTDVVGILYSNPLSYAFDDPAAVSFLRGLSAVTEEADLGLLLVPAAGPGSTAGRDPRKAAEHLLDLGHQRFAVVSFALSPDGREGIADPGRQEEAAFRVSRLRLRGYRTALEDAGLRWPEVPVYECPGSTKDLGRRAAEALLSSEKPRPTALLALSDQLALGIVHVAKERGLSVPGDLSLIGFDDAPSAVSASPRLTTVHQNHAEKGLLAGQILVSRLREEEGPSAEWLPTRLIVRDSTAPPRQL